MGSWLLIGSAKLIPHAVLPVDVLFYSMDCSCHFNSITFFMVIHRSALKKEN